MGADTSISWCDATWNPIRGCSRVSDGCTRCYAERVAARFSDPGQPYHGLARRVNHQPRWTGEVRLIAEHLADPLRWRRPRRIFVNSMSDLFHEKLTNEQIAAVFGVMAACPQHTFQVLTKRANRMRWWFEWLETAAPGYGLNKLGVCVHEGTEHCPPGKRPGVTNDMWHRIRGNEWPLPNVWLGVSVENQEAADERIPELLDTPAAIRFLSCEPLLGEVSIPSYLRGTAQHSAIAAYAGLTDEPGIDWVIAGCESGPRARPCDVAWLRSLRDQCAAAGVPFFLKQAVMQIGLLGRDIVANKVGSRIKQSGVIELPYLDGVQHAAFPEVING
jgi:protein gp37